MSESIEPVHYWIVCDWAGNICFDNRKFQSFEDVEEFLICQLGDKYDTDRQEYYIGETSE
jgi:hypothetical protein